MNIYVKENEMPKYCAACPFYNNWKGRCIFKFSFFSIPSFAYKTRQKFCPLKPLNKEEIEKETFNAFRRRITKIYNFDNVAEREELKFGKTEQLKVNLIPIAESNLKDIF